MSLEKVPIKILDEYAAVIILMASARTPALVSIYGKLEKQRKEIHEYILCFANKEREDDSFAYELAKYLERYE